MIAGWGLIFFFLRIYFDKIHALANGPTRMPLQATLTRFGGLCKKARDMKLGGRCVEVHRRKLDGDYVFL